MLHRLRFFFFPGFALAILLFIAGCCTKESDAESSDETVGAGDVVDYFIGKTPIEHGARMEGEIRDIQKKHDDQFRDILGEEENE